MFTMSPATIPWSLGADVDRRLAGQHPGPCLDARHPSRARTAATSSSAGPDGALGIVLVGDRRAPDRHDRVADELLDGAAVALDDSRARSKYRAGAHARPRRRGLPPAS